MREHGDNDNLKIATQSVCVTVYTRQYLATCRSEGDYQISTRFNIETGRGAGASVIQVCTLQIPVNSKRVKAYAFRLFLYKNYNMPTCRFLMY